MQRLLVAFVLATSMGCVQTRPQRDAVTDPQTPAADLPSAIQAVSYQDEAPAELAPLPESVAPALDVGDSDSLTLTHLEAIAIVSNPTLRQARARVAAARGRWVQGGLRPNPVLSFTGAEIGNEGAAGQHGMFVGQQFVTHGKLHLNQHVAASEIERAEQQAYAQELRVLTDVRLAFYDSLISQRRVEITQEIQGISRRAADTIRDLVAGDQATRIELLQSEVEAESARLLVTTSRNNRQAAWRRLAAVLGTPDRPLGDVSGIVDQSLPVILWDETLEQLQQESPEMAAAVASVERAHWALERARVQAMPNVNVQLGVTYDDSTDDVFSGVQVSIPVPIHNANQGGIQTARAQLVEAEHDISRIELDLQRRLSAVFSRYANARQQANQYDQAILPKAAETLELVTLGYKAGEYPYLTLLTAQRTLFNAQLAYLDALSEIWAANVEVEGMLLKGSLGRS